MFNTLKLDVNGNLCGSHAYGDEPPSLPPDEIACTSAQAQAPQAWSFVNGALIESITFARASQCANLSVACAGAIVAGFASSALGVPHTYPSQPTDQSNLIGAEAASRNPANPSTWTVPFWCADSTGVWALRAHTAAQIQQVLADGVAARVALSQKLAGLVAQVNAATTIAAVQAVVWA